MNSGVRIGGGDLMGGPVVEAPTEYATLVWDPALGKAVPDETYTMNAGLLAALATIGPAARAAGARANGARFRGPSKPLRVAPIRYVVASADDQTTVAGASPASFTSAVTALKAQVAANPQQRGKLQVLPVAE